MRLKLTNKKPYTWLFAILLISAGTAQAQNEQPMNYVHQEKESFSSKLMKGVLRLARLKTLVEKNAAKAEIKQDAAHIPKKLKKKFKVEESIFLGRNVWKITPAIPSGKTVVFLHGGAYIFNLGSFHWEFVGDMVARTGDTYLVVDYPLAPSNTMNDAHEMLTEIMKSINDEKIVFIGDSAGAGLALSFAIENKNNDERIKALILISPFVNVTMNNEKVDSIEPKDVMLTAKGLRAVGELYRGELDDKDPKISPLYGDLTHLPPTSIFIGGNDILSADAVLLKAKLVDAKVACNYYEYPKMMHDWVVFSQIKEAHGARSQITDLINGF
ncbi:MAG: alpha/beta hydrolase [Bacteroidia bacterium]